MSNEISKMFLTIMKDMKVSKVELSRRLNVSRARITQMLSSATNWEITTITKVADVLGCEVQILIKSSEK